MLFDKYIFLKAIQLNIVCQVSDVVHGPLESMINVSGDAEGMAIFVIFK